MPQQVLLIDFLPPTTASEPQGLISLLQQKFREKHLVPFSNNFNLISTIDCRQYFKQTFEPLFDVKLSRQCSCLVALTRYSFMIIDQVTNYKSYIISHGKKVSCFTIEENYNGRGFDALICNQINSYDSQCVLKYDLREYIEKKGVCNPLWKVEGTYTDKAINVLILEGRRVVSVDNSNSVRFYDTIDGTPLEKYNTKVPGLNGSICVDSLAENSFLVVVDRLIQRFEYVNGEWSQKIFCYREMECLVDFIDMDRISGITYFIINPAFGKYKAVVLDREGKSILEKKLTHGSSGLCLNRFTGRLFVAHDTFIYVYE